MLTLTTPWIRRLSPDVDPAASPVSITRLAKITRQV